MIRHNRIVLNVDEVIELIKSDSFYEDQERKGKRRVRTVLCTELG